ncbi:dipeptide/oligopeptide/nickel ABC transporter permease/ATP-binding protein [Microbacterium sp. NPDC077663]|uniref:dipeptide/oligopeptide/nickel ABC transporter permease/ATP-binding protein n=1 Tax=Microbacterium sp. NPDC077663 TaxID=3364189 RepID=UPI0037CBFA5D
MRFVRPFFSSPTRAAATLMILALIILALIGPLVWGEAAVTSNAAEINQPPSSEYPLGTDSLGRDVLARVLTATQISLVMAIIATLTAAILGLLIGAVPSVLGPRTQRAFAAVLSTWMAFPVLLLALFITILLGAGAVTAVIALSLTMAPAFGRLMQTLAAGIQSSDYLSAARILGISRRRQFTRYIVPNIAEPIIVYVTLAIGSALLALSALSFLGLGVQPPSFDWGRMLGESLPNIYTAPWATVSPGVAVVVAGLAFGLAGEAIAGATRDRTSGTTSARARRRLSTPPRPEVEEAITARGVAVVSPGPGDPILTIERLSVSFATEDGWRTPVKDVTFTLSEGELVGIVGESGSGKSVTAMAIARLLPDTAVVSASRADFEGVPLLESPESELRNALSTDIGIVFQDSLTALNPALRVGPQLAEVLEAAGVGREEAKRRAVDALAAVRISEPARRAAQFPHQFSGGMRQRALIAMAQIGQPRLVIADEPTTALDVTVQRHVLTLLRQYCAESGAAALVVSHDIAVLGELCSRVLVMYDGRIVENIASADLAHPERLKHPYSRALVAALPDLDSDRSVPLATIPEVHPEWWAQAHLQAATVEGDR